MAAGNGKARFGNRHRRGDTLVSGTSDITQLDCNCLCTNGRIGDERYCARHRKVSTVVRSAPEWRVTCVNCTWTKREGLAEITAGIDAHRHARRRQHRVQIWCGAEMRQELGPRPPGQMSLYGT